MQKYMRTFAYKILHADYHNLQVFGLLESLHCWLSECNNCTCAGGFVSINQLLVSVVSIKLSGLKLIQGFRPNEHFFKIFTCASLETSLIL